MEYIVSVGRPEEMESLGAERLVRCKDCKHYRPGRLIECEQHNACQPKPDFYCADGEPKEGEQE